MSSTTLEPTPARRGDRTGAGTPSGRSGNGTSTGPGGGVACSGKSREGTVVSDPEGLRMLYANADGSHQGYSCKSNSDSCGNKPEWQFDWKGDPDATWALARFPAELAAARRALVGD